MLSLREELAKMLLVKSFFKAGLRHRLFNFRQLARFLKPELEKRLKKEVSEGSIHVALTRMRADLEKEARDAEMRIDDVSDLPEPDQILTNLYWARFKKSPVNVRHLATWLTWLNSQKAFVMKWESGKLIEMILQQGFLEEMSHKSAVKPTHVETNLVGLVYRVAKIEATQLHFDLLHHLYFNCVQPVFWNFSDGELLLCVKREDLSKVL